MKQWADHLVVEYFDWLKETTVVTTDPTTDWISIDTPFTGLFNDTITFYVKKEGNDIFLSDDGQTLTNLDLVGVEMSRSKNRRVFVERILNNFGIQLTGNELTARTNETNFKQKKYNFLSAILEINSLHVLAPSGVSSIFKDDVRGYLDEIEVIYTPEFVAKGSATQLDFTFDFQIAGRNSEIVMKAFNTLKQPFISHFLFSWDDIKPSREKTTRKAIQAIAIINDTDKNINQGYVQALEAKDSEVLFWSKRYEPESISRLKKVA